MATFTTEVNIDVDEFMDELSSTEIKEVYEWLEENGTSIHEKLNFDEVQTLKNLEKLKANLIQLTKEEVDIINQVTKRF
jgi:nanoRNase/pAp phosphatase (c-di-AMP/oligoRNAs hydrolase)